MLQAAGFMSIDAIKPRFLTRSVVGALRDGFNRPGIPVPPGSSSGEVIDVTNLTADNAAVASLASAHRFLPERLLRTNTVQETQ